MKDNKYATPKNIEIIGNKPIGKSIIPDGFVNTPSDHVKKFIKIKISVILLKFTLVWINIRNFNINMNLLHNGKYKLD
jgi:hypothetical protein